MALYFNLCPWSKDNNCHYIKWIKVFKLVPFPVSMSSWGFLTEQYQWEWPPFKTSDRSFLSQRYISEEKNHVFPLLPWNRSIYNFSREPDCLLATWSGGPLHLMTLNRFNLLIGISTLLTSRDGRSQENSYSNGVLAAKSQQSSASIKNLFRGHRISYFSICY